MVQWLHQGMIRVNYSMKITKKTRPTKANLSGTILLVLGLFSLYSSVAQTEPRMKHQVNVVLMINNVAIEVKSPSNNIVNHYAYPTITSEVFNQYNQSAMHLATQISQQPSLGIKVTDFANLTPHKFDKKNSIFEFAAKFNDKLQQVLAYFDFSSTSTDGKNKNISDKNLQQKSNLITKNISNSLKARTLD